MTSIAPAPTRPSPAMPLAIMPTDLQSAARLLHQFDATALGEGDLTAGANTLAVMALAIANITPPGSCVSDDDGMHVPVGMGMMVSGALSCGIIDDRVLAVLEKLQGNVYAHIRQQLARKKHHQSRISAGNLFFNNKGEKERPPTLLDQLENNEFMTDSSFESEWLSLVKPPPNPDIAEITDAPVFFAGIGSADGLDSAVGFANKGRLLVHATLTGKSDAALMARVFREVVSGCPKRKILAASIRGEMIATDPLSMLDGLLADGTDRGWLGSMLWLGDHADGPLFEMHESATTTPQLRRVGDWFSLAIEGVAATRLNIHKSSPMTLTYAIKSEQTRWNAFLLGLEPNSPGIAGALRPLLVSLVFGLVNIVSAAPAGQGIRFSVEHVAAWARVLVLRMVHHREAILGEARRKWLETLTARIRLKLADGPQSVRDLTRRSYRLDAPTCLQVLERLADSGLVVRRGSHWQLAVQGRSKTLTTVDV